jgi:hypothetical protein
MFSFLRNKILCKGIAFTALLLFLSVGLLFVSCPNPADGETGPPPSGHPDSGTHGTPGNPGDSGNPGTPSGPPPSGSILINSAEELAKIGADSDYPLTGTYVLMENVILTDWVPIGGQEKPFTGKFNGWGKTITISSFQAGALTGATVTSPAYNYLGVFGNVRGASGTAKAEIKNLTINSAVNATSSGNRATIGLLAGYTENAEIEHITLSGTFGIASSKALVVGGIAGLIDTGTVIKNCKSSMTMNITPGNGDGAASIATASISFVGGFAGKFDNGAGIENCHNSGNVTATSTAASSQISVGGITGGNYDAVVAFEGYIQDCSFTGNVLGRAMGDWTLAGGIAGAITGGNNVKASSTRIERCFATRSISVEGTSTGWPYIGGIVGYVYMGGWVMESYFTGTVLADKGSDYTGGIAGYTSQQADTANYARVIDCWSSGTVQGSTNAGGIVGQNQQSAHIERCYSIATVRCSGSKPIIGGILGLNGSYAAPVVDSCVALNVFLSSRSGEDIHRVVGSNYSGSSAGFPNPAIIKKCYALAGMIVDPGIGSPIADKKADGADGADIPANLLSGGKPTQEFYQTTLGWDFPNVWKMGSNGYPVLWWQ